MDIYNSISVVTIPQHFFHILYDFMSSGFWGLLNWIAHVIPSSVSLFLPSQTMVFNLPIPGSLLSASMAVQPSYNSPTSYAPLCSIYHNV
jgi:hypothetical protein